MKNTLFTLALILAPLSASAQFTKLKDFDDTTGTEPYGHLIAVGQFLYGMTSAGGADNEGTIFKIRADGTGFGKLLDFSAATGLNPEGSLIYDGTFLYGMTKEGGINDQGTIFKIKPDATGFTKVLEFSDDSSGARPHGSLYYDGSFLYAMTNIGGGNNMGTIIKVRPDGSGYTKLLDFAGTANGSDAHGTFISDGTFLYGMTRTGGVNNTGTVFKILPNGSGYVKLLDFIGPTNGTFPYGDLISEGTFLYGMTSEGGANNFGTVFKIRPDGTGYQKLLDFNGSANGDEPFGNLVMDGEFLYGMTAAGGTTDTGVLFKIKPDGTGYEKLFNFISTATGKYPNGTLLPIGSFLYGLTSAGGAGGGGIFFKYQHITTGVSVKIIQKDFTVIPNPSNGLFTLIMKGSELAGYRVEIVNSTGMSIYPCSGVEKSGSYEIDLTGFPKGIYLAKIRDAASVTMKKIILQ